MTTIYKLRIELIGSDPKIWRSVTVPGNTTFDHLHDIIQIAMGWNNEYSFEFKIDDISVTDFGPEVDMGEDPTKRDAMDSFLDELVTKVDSTFTYIYNFDDLWEHQITLEEIFTSDEDFNPPVCTGGEIGCPPDDLGGVSVHQALLEEEGIIADFDLEEVNDWLSEYAEEWEEIYRDSEELIEGLEDNDEERSEVKIDEYESAKGIRTPEDLLNGWAKPDMEDWIEVALQDETSAESKAFARLIANGHSEIEIPAMILGPLSVEWFYELKYNIDRLDDRYLYNLDQLPEKEIEIPSVDYAVRILDQCEKGIPFTAIAYLHDDKSSAATSAILKALSNFSDDRYFWTTPLWYALAAEGHLCEELIDAVIGLYTSDSENTSDWLREQGQYLIGKLAQKYPDIVANKVLDSMEKDAQLSPQHSVHYLFEVFDFCNLDKYKFRLIALLKRDEISWHDMLAISMAHLQIKEGLPILKEQSARLKARSLSKKGEWVNHHLVEIDEAILQLETGKDLFPEVDTPLCLKRPAWREEFADAEHYFYEDDNVSEVASDGLRYRS